MAHITKVKICGLKTVEDAVAAAEAGADAIGLNFYEPSLRYLGDRNVAAQIARSVGPFVSVVGLFVNASAETIKSVLASVPLSHLQFHGDEDSAFCEQFGRPYLKAVRMKDDVQLDELIHTYQNANGLLLDAYQPGVPGGTGEKFDWQRIPHDLDMPIVLAGGLTPDNVGQAIEQVRPWAVDVSGGVESAKGVKSVDLIQTFIANAKRSI